MSATARAKAEQVVRDWWYPGDTAPFAARHPNAKLVEMVGAALDAYAAAQTAALRAALESIRDYRQDHSKAFDAWTAYGFCLDVAARALLAEPEGPHS